MEFRTSVRALCAYRLLIVGCVAICTTVAAVPAWTQPPSYTARTQLFISAAGAGDGGGAAYEAALLSEGRAPSYVQLAESPRVLDAVILQLHLPESRKELKRQLRVTSLPNTVVLNVAVQNRSRQLALALAAAFAQQCDVRRPARSATVRTVERQADDHECGTAPAVPDLTA